MRHAHLIAIGLFFLGSGPARGEWARTAIAEFPKHGYRPKLVALDDGPAITVFEGKTLHVLRWRGGNWMKSSIPLAAETNYVEACACRGDGVRRLYVGSLRDARIFEIAPYGPTWEQVEFSPNGDPRIPALGHTEGMTSATSHVDGRPSLFIRRALRGRTVECRGEKDGWDCAPAVGAAQISIMAPLANPPGWPERDFLIEDNTVYARQGSTWTAVSAFDSGFFIPSKIHPRLVYAFGSKGYEIQLGPDLKPELKRPFIDDESAVEVDPRTVPIPSAPGSRLFRAGHTHGFETAVGQPRGKGQESLFEPVEATQLHEFRKVGGSWTDSVIVSFAGGAYQPFVGDARGDGVERVYVLVRDKPNYLGGNSVLWELSYYERRSLVIVPDPASAFVERDGLKLLGELIRAELGRHGHLSVSDERSQAAARTERMLMKDGGEGGYTAGYTLSIDISKETELLMLHARLSGPELSVRTFEVTSASRSELPQAALALARRIAEEWPVARATP